MMWVIVAGVLAMAGLMLVFIGRRGRRVNDHPICRRCHHDLFGTAELPVKCPECGGDLDRRRAVYRGRRERRNALIVAGAIVLTTGWNAADPLVSIMIAALIAAGSWRLLREPIDVLMEAAPAGIDVGEIGRAIAADRDVLEAHDLHVWAVTSGFPALSAHLVVRRGANRDLVRARVEALLGERFEIRHTTLQVVESSEHGLIAVENVPGDS
jgi:hypothetical protein